MPKGKATRLRASEVMPVPIHCSGTGCEEETALILPGKLPYKQGVWLEDGWMALNHLENRSVLFLCASCRAKGEASS
ncbi:MAG: hypothetical protein L3J93_00325 [Thermoplasmata archaeon]|nr:hypothetical protein [Thermoplasmata archaeon]